MDTANTIHQRFVRTVAGVLAIGEAAVVPQADLITDLAADSLETIELVIALEDEFAIEIPDEKWEKVATVANAEALINKILEQD